MVRRSTSLVTLVLALTFGVAFAAAIERGTQAKPADTKGNGGWTIRPDAEQKKSPLTVNAQVLAQGKSIFKNKCQKCHGAAGLGDGPDADPDHQADMDLTVASRAAKNPDGVVFYKVSNGRKGPKMPAFKDDLNEQQIWTVIAYAQSLRGK